MVASAKGMLILSCSIVVLEFGIIGKAELSEVNRQEQKRKIKEEKVKCEITLKNSSVLDEEIETESYCPAIWDGILCWPATEPGNLASLQCPAYIDKFNTDYMASRLCTENGTWFRKLNKNSSWTDFSQCLTVKNVDKIMGKHMLYLKLLYEIGYGLSLVSLTIAVVIMIYFRRLHCQRNSIHINLFVSFILRAAFSFTKEKLLVEGVGFASDIRETKRGVKFIEEGTHWQCKLFFTLFHYILASNYMWIFVESLYLHSLISTAMISKTCGTIRYVLFGWGSSLTFVFPWVLVRIYKENELCWNTNDVAAYFWIMRGPILLSIVINFFFFLNVVRILFTKLNAAISPEAQKFRPSNISNGSLSCYIAKRLAKSTLVLIPLFGIHYIVFGGIPDKMDIKTELIKLYFDMVFNSLQGFFVSLLFCFLNSEVQNEIFKMWQRSQLSNFSGFSCLFSTCKIRKPGRRRSYDAATARSDMSTVVSMSVLQTQDKESPVGVNCIEKPLNDVESQPMINARVVEIS